MPSCTLYCGGKLLIPVNPAGGTLPEAPFLGSRSLLSAPLGSTVPGLGLQVHLPGSRALQGMSEALLHAQHLARNWCHAGAQRHLQNQ